MDVNISFWGDTIQPIVGTHWHRLNENLQETQKEICFRLFSQEEGWARKRVYGIRKRKAEGTLVSFQKVPVSWGWHRIIRDTWMHRGHWT